MPQGLPPELTGLLSADAYPHPVGAIRLIETHISWVLLAGDYAYKIARPVRYAFIDLTDASRRAAVADDGLRLNRRFAPALYLDVCDVVRRDGAARIGGPGPVLARALRMRRFPTQQVLDQLLDDEAARPDGIGPEALERFGRELADVHANLPAAAAGDPMAAPERIAAALRENLRQCRGALPAAHERLERMGLRLEVVLAAAAPAIAARCAGGRIRECHGDLHAGNVVRLGDSLLAFDCLEFDAALRWIDVADDVAFLHVDLCVRGRPGHAQALLDGYLSRGGDYDACRVLDLYRAHRALIRAKVAALSQAPPSRIDAWLGAAEGALAPPRPRLVLTCGYSGSGKTWLAHRLASRLGAVHLRSDVERKRMAGLAETASSRSLPGGGLYAEARSAAVYQRLEDCAAAVLEGGRSVVVDAAFLQRAQRSQWIGLAARHGLRPQLLRVTAPRAVLLERLAARAASGRDASEADAAVLDWQLRHAEPVGAEEGFELREVDSLALSDPAKLDALLAIT